MNETQARKKILYLVTQSNFGGAQKYVFDLATGLDKAKYDVAVAAGGHGELLKQLEQKGINVFKLKWLRRPICSIRDTLAYFEIKRLLKEWQPDVLHLNSSKAGILGCLAARHLPIKVVYTIHGSVFEAAFPSLAQKFFLYLEKKTAKYKHKIICVSENDRVLWLKYKLVPTEKLVTIHNGINIYATSLTREEARQRLFQNAPQNYNDYQVVGWNGWFYPEKNLEALIQAANLIFTLPKYQNKKILFVIFGNGPQEKILKLEVKKINLENRVIFPGAVPEGAKYLKAFDVFVLPSIKEGLPYTIMEAMAAGVPIVASNVGGIPEMIEDGKNGFLVAPRDFEALAEKILQILENQELAQKFSRNSLEKVKEFTLEKMVSKTEQQY